MGILIATSYHAAGANATIWVPISYVIGPLGTSLLAARYGEGGWTQFDRYCLLGAMMSLGLWVGLRSPDLTLAINIGIDFLGALPTIRKAWRDPHSEDLLAWGLFTIANLLNAIAIDRWIWQVSLYPIYLAMLTVGIFWLVWHGRRQQKSI